MTQVTDADREFVALWVVIAPENAKKIRAGEWDGHPAVQAAVAHRNQPTAAQMGENQRLRALMVKVQDSLCKAYCSWAKLDDHPLEHFGDCVELQAALSTTDTIGGGEAESERCGCGYDNPDDVCLYHEKITLARHALATPQPVSGDAVREVLEASKAAEGAMGEMFRYFDGGETRGSYDGRPERDGLRRAWYKLRAALAALNHGGTQ